MSKRKIKQTYEIAKMVFGSVGSTKMFKTKPTFLPPNLKLFDTPNFIAPSEEFVSKAIETLQTERLLVLAGGYGINKVILARYLAWQFSNQYPLTSPSSSIEIDEIEKETEHEEPLEESPLAELKEEDNQSLLIESKEEESDFSFPNDEQRTVDEEISIKEWLHSSEPQSIDGEFFQQQQPTVYLFTQVSRQNFNYGLSRIQKAAQKNHYLIITTDVPQEHWHLSTEEQNFWLDLESLPYQLYNSESLIVALNNEFKSKKTLQSLPEDETLKNQIVKQLKQSLPNDETFKNSIQTPEQMARFISLLIQELKTETSLKTAIDNAMNTANHYQQNLKDWYDFILDEQEQLLALGLNLFEGLLVDQIFAALEEIVNNVWQKRDPALRAPDYHDLVKFRHFFQFGITGLDSKEQNFIESYVSKQRLMLFEMAWHSHGRQLLATLPTINHLLQNAVSNRVSNEELYGTPMRRKQLQRVLTEAISDIGWISPTTVQKTLCQFAECESTRLRMNAAYAIARWRNNHYYGHDKERFEKRHQDLLALLNQWQEKASIQNGTPVMSSEAKNLKKKMALAPRSGFFSRFFRNNANQTKNEKPYPTQDYLRATIAFTVGYAAIYDPPDQLHQTLYNFLERLADDQNHYDQNNPAHLAFCFHTLPKVVPWHLLQLRELLRDMTRYPDFIGAISDSLALAYQARPADVLKTLESWKDHEQETITIFSKKATLPLRELLLTTIALTYGKITCDEDIYRLTAKQAFQYLPELLETDKSLLVRQAVIIAMGMKLHQNFSEIESEFQNAIPKITQYEHERRKIVDILTLIDLEQSERDTVKTAMYRWITDNSNPIAQEIALRALVNFTRVSSNPNQAKQLKQNWLNVRFSKSPIVSKTPPYGPSFDKLIPWMVTRDNKSYKKAISQLLHQAWKLHKNNKNAINSVLSHWEQTTTDNRKLVHLSQLLKRGFWWLKYLSVLPIGVIGLIIALLVVPVMTKELLPILSNYRGTLSSLPKSKHIIDEGASLLIAEKARIRDSDSANFEGGKLSIQLTENATANDRLGIRISALTEEMALRAKQNEKQGLVYQIWYRGKRIGYLPGDDSLPFEVTLTAHATQEETKALIRTLAYQNTSKAPVLGERKVELQLTDGDGGNSQAFSKTITVVTENQAPVILIPDEMKTQTLRETHKLSLRGLSVSDAEGQELTVTLHANLGKLTVKQNVPRGLKSQNITHADSVVLQGTVEQINTTLAHRSAITYQSHLGASGEDLLQITVEDRGKQITHKKGLAWPPGAIEPQKTLATIKITVLPAIILTVPGEQTVDEDRGLSIGGISIEAPDSKNATVEFEVNHGSLMIKDNVAKGINHWGIQANNTAKVTIKPSSIARLNLTLQHQEAIIYQGADDSAVPDILKMTVIDNEKRRAEQSIKILVNPINDAPEITEEPEKPMNSEPLPIKEPIVIPPVTVTPKVKAPPVPKKTVPQKRETKTAISRTSQWTLGQRAKNKADARYKRLSSPSPRKWWRLLCRTINEVYNQEVAKTKVTTRKEKRQIRRKVFNGTVDVIRQDERKKRNGWSRNRIKNKVSAVCK
jgi:hypothetical protein